MLKKEFRLNKRKDFEEIKVKGKLRNGELFSVLELKGGQSIKVAVVVSKKISKKAVERNKIRRKMYLMIGKNMNIFLEGARVLFLVKKNILNRSEAEMEKCLKKLF